jgi:hypothetical protein
MLKTLKDIAADQINYIFLKLTLFLIRKLRLSETVSNLVISEYSNILNASIKKLENEFQILSYKYNKVKSKLKKGRKNKQATVKDVVFLWIYIIQSYSQSIRCILRVLSLHIPSKNFDKK